MRIVENGDEAVAVLAQALRAGEISGEQGTCFLQTINEVLRIAG